MMKIHTCIIVALAVILSACGSTKKSVIHRSTDNLAFPDNIFLDISNLSETNVDLTELGYDGDQLASSMYQANLNAAMNNANHSAAGGLAGALIAGSLVRSIAEQNLIKTKNEPVNNFLEMLNTNEWSQLFTGSKINGRKVLLNPVNGASMKITPVLSVSLDYRSLSLQSLIEIYSSPKNVVHRNYYHIESEPLLGPNETISNLNMKEKEAVNQLVLSMFARMGELIEMDLATPAEYVNQAVRFTNQRGEFYSRGEVLKACDKTVVFRTLRKEVKEIPCV